MSNIILQCKNMTKAYKDTAEELNVLNNVNLNVSKGEQIAIVGSSGSGKSTLLHILGGLDQPTSGEVTLLGLKLNTLSEDKLGRLRNKEVGFIYQFHHLLPEFTALENVAMPLLIRGESIQKASAQAANILEKVGLKNRLAHKPSALSGGERQRAAVARALVTKPKCVLADEPTGNLDDQTAQLIYALMLGLHQELGTSLVVVTHDMTLAGKMDKVYQLEKGQLVS